MDASDRAMPSLPPDFEKWFWTARMAKFALYAGVTVGAIVGAFVSLVQPVLAMILQRGEGPVRDGGIPALSMILRDAAWATFVGGFWGGVLLFPVTVPLGLLLDWIELRRMRDAEQAVKDLQQSRFMDRKPS
ncbi:MAG: hypothetical protein K2X38_07610 [Gemmataceae bacterium]|nr:hypothetical protein [Gemmataceae bacterium]